MGTVKEIIDVLTGHSRARSHRREQTRGARSDEAAADDRPPAASYEIQDVINQFFEASQDGFFIYDSNPPRQVYVSRAIEKMYGIASEVFYSDPSRWSERIHPDDKEATMKALEEWVTGASDATYDVVHRVVRPDNEIRWIHVRGIWVSRDARGNHRAAGIATDITHRKLAEEAFRRSELHRRQLIAERDRISQDLHDSILQSLYGVGLTLEAVKVLLREAPDRALAQIHKAGTDLNSLIGEIRAFLGDLTPSLLGGTALATALADLAGSIRTGGCRNLQVEIDKPAIDEIPDEYGNDILNIVKEAISNAVRHARADHIGLVIRRVEHGTRIEVRDDGLGFVPDAVEGRGLGLRNIAARAKRIGTQLQLESAPGAGTCLRIDINRERSGRGLE
jgi:PAS domain S-box-containing protein